MTDRHLDPDRQRRLATLERIRHKLPRSLRDLPAAELDRRLRAMGRDRRAAAKGVCRCGR